MLVKKMHHMVPWESQIEELYLEWLEVDPDVLQFYAQPATVIFGKGFYTPDVMVISRTAEYFVEIKPDSVFQDQKTMERIKALQAHFASYGNELRLITKKQLISQPLRDNVLALNRMLLREEHAAWSSRIVNRCQGKPCTIGELKDRTGNDRHTVDFIKSAIVRGYLHIDLTKPATDSSVVTPYSRSV